jgi:hypothetical protein
MTPLHQLGELIRQALLQIPLGMVKAAFVAVPLVLVIWLWRLPPPEEPGTPDSASLKRWAIVALAVQAGVYALLG